MKFIKINFVVVVSLLCLFSSCKESKFINLEGYKIIPQDSLLLWLDEGRFQKPKDVKYLDSNNVIINVDSVFRIKNMRDIKLSYFADKLNRIKYIKMTTANINDKMLFDKMTQIENSKLVVDKSNVNLVQVDCAQKGNILDEVLERDQNNRSRGIQSMDLRADNKNLELVISLHNKCGLSLFEDLTKDQLMAIWLVIQHSSPTWREEFFNIFNNSPVKKRLKKEWLVLMEDRILMDKNLPQKYGTQIQDSKLYKIDNLDSVRLRRKKLGMQDLDDYLNELID